MKHLLIHLDDEEYRELSQEKDKRGLTWKELLLSIRSKDDKESLDKRRGRDHAETTSESPQASNALSPPVVAASDHPQRSRELSRSVGDPAPKRRCRRCGGIPKFDSQIEEWCCGTCGAILRLQKS